MGHVRVLLPRKLSPTSAYGVISRYWETFKEHSAPILLEGKVQWTWRAMSPWIASNPCPRSGGTRQGIKLNWEAEVRCWFEKWKPSILRQKRQAIFPGAEMTSLLPWDCWWHSTMILGINKMEAHTVYQASGPSERLNKTHACFSADRSGLGQRDHTPSEDAPRTRRMLPSHTSSPNSDGLHNTWMP